MKAGLRISLFVVFAGMPHVSLKEHHDAPDAGDADQSVYDARERSHGTEQ